MKQSGIDRSELLRRRILEDWEQSFRKKIQQALMIGTIVVSAYAGTFTYLASDLLEATRLTLYTVSERYKLSESRLRLRVDQINGLLVQLELYAGESLPGSQRESNNQIQPTQ